jgi:hypothetical protein
VKTIKSSSAFKIPQVQLPNAAVAKQINRWLLRYARAEFSTVDSTATPQRQLHQAERECCYDKDEKKWVVGDGLTGTTYQVLLNQGYLLSLEFQHDYRGMSEMRTYHFTFDLRTGRLLTLADLLTDSPGQLQHRLALAVSRRLHEELATVTASAGDSAVVAHVAELYDVAPWDTTPQHALQIGADKISVASPLEFALRRDAVLLYHAISMSRFDIPYQPDEQYVFPFSRLRPRGLLLQLAAAPVKEEKSRKEKKRK